MQTQLPEYDFDMVRDLVPQIKKLITDTFRATVHKVDPDRLHNSFEVSLTSPLTPTAIRLRLHDRRGLPTLPYRSQYKPLPRNLLPSPLTHYTRTN